MIWVTQHGNWEGMMGRPRRYRTQLSPEPLALLSRLTFPSHWLLHSLHAFEGWRTGEWHTRADFICDTIHRQIDASAVCGAEWFASERISRRAMCARILQ